MGWWTQGTVSAVSGETGSRFELPVAANEWIPVTAQRNATGYASGTLGSNAINTQSFARYLPFYVGKSVEIDALSLLCSTANAGASAVLRLGAHLDNAGRPGDVLIDGGTASINSTGQKTLTFSPVALPVGWVWFVAVCQNIDTAGVNPAFAVGAVQSVSGSVTLPTSNNMFTSKWATGVSGALTANPTIGESSSITAATFHIWMRVSTP